jgi:hypothetical protein
MAHELSMHPDAVASRKRRTEKRPGDSLGNWNPRNWSLAEAARELFGTDRIRESAHGRYVAKDFTEDERTAIEAHAGQVMVVKRVFIVPEDFKEEYRQRPKADKSLPSDIKREDKPVRNAVQPKAWQDVEPTDEQKAYMLTVLQKGVDTFGVLEGTFFKRGNTYKKTKFHASHIKSIAEFNDGREHWWNDDYSPNWTMRAEFVNEFESSYPDAAERDRRTKARLDESRIVYNISELEVRSLANDPSTVILEIKVKTMAATA